MDEKWVYLMPKIKELRLSLRSGTVIKKLDFQQVLGLLYCGFRTSGISILFIEADTTHNWLQHVHAKKLVLNFFAATGHNNYAKTCRLYLQSISTLEEKHPQQL